MYRPAHNATDSPVLIDDRGRQLGGREWGAVDTRAAEVKAAVASGAVTVFDPDRIGDDTLPEAQAARDRAAELQARHEVLTGFDADATRELAGAAGIPLEAEAFDDDGRPADPRRRHVNELVADLVYADVPTELAADASPPSTDSTAEPSTSAEPAKARGARKSTPTPTIPEA